MAPVYCGRWLFECILRDNEHWNIDPELALILVNWTVSSLECLLIMQKPAQTHPNTLKKIKTAKTSQALPVLVKAGLTGWF